MTIAHARTTDPYTSHAAAAVATRSLPTVKAAVMRIFEEAREPITHDQLLARFRQAAMRGEAPRRATDSSIRSRCSELEKAGRVTVIETPGRSRLGNQARLRVASSVQNQWTNDQQKWTAE